MALRQHDVLRRRIVESPSRATVVATVLLAVRSTVAPMRA